MARTSATTLRADLPDRHPRDVAVLTGWPLRDQPAVGRQGHHRAAAADGANMRVATWTASASASPGTTAPSSTASASPPNTTQDIWKDHPKVLGTTATSSRSTPTPRAVIAGRSAGSQPLDRRRPVNQAEDRRDVADKSYVNTGVDAINQRILGRYQNGLGRTWDDPAPHEVLRRRRGQLPVPQDGMWFLTQHKRWGLLKTTPTTWAVARQINQIDSTSRAAGRQGQRAQDPTCAAAS